MSQDACDDFPIGNVQDMIKYIDTFQKLIRAIISAGAVVLLALGVWYGYDLISSRNSQKQALQSAREKLRSTRKDLSDMRKQIETKNRKLREQQERISSLTETVSRQKKTINRLETEMKLLKTDHRAARLTVLSQERKNGNDPVKTRVKFVELGPDGEPFGRPRTFTLDSPVVYVDGWIVKFANEYVRKRNLHRSSSLLLFRRIYGQKQSPESGHRLDRPDAIPRIYHPETENGSFMKTIWKDFWSVANDRSKQKKLGIRAMHGTAGYMSVKPGRTYRVLLRSSGDVSIVPAPVPDE